MGSRFAGSHFGGVEEIGLGSNGDVNHTKLGKGLSIFLERRRVRPLDDSSYDKPSGLIEVIIASSAQRPELGSWTITP